jgi:hypothetical protein
MGELRGHRLTAIVSGWAQVAASAQAVASTQLPIGTIMPFCSASGMKSAGETRPRIGWFHRNSASQPDT